MLRSLLGVSLTTAGLMATAAVAPANAALGEYVRTESGLTRCWVSTEIVSCETGDIGFLNAPPTDPPGHHVHVGSVTPDGEFNWVIGNIGGADPAGRQALTYGQTFKLHGWTVKPTSAGTRFTNDDTGHGMFVSVQKVQSF